MKERIIFNQKWYEENDIYVEYKKILNTYICVVILH